ncbi:MAG TPA: PilZ domain-containing protein [Roseomonas sp.]|jgi:hypothetical protein
MLQALRWQLETILAEAPVLGNTLEAIALRARLAALFDAEITRHETRVKLTDGGLAREKPPVHQEKRRWPRYPVLLNAQISIGASTFDCVVVDLSEGGAQVDFAIPVPLPELVTLRIGNGGAYSARRRWIRGTRTGLEFTEAASMSFGSSGTGG